MEEEGRKSTGKLDKDILRRARSIEERRSPTEKNKMDEVVKSILTEGEERARRRRMSPEERRRAEREAERTKFCLYFPPKLWERLKNRAEEYNCSYSNLARFGLSAGLALHAQGKIPANEFLVPISHLRWSSKFVLPGDDDKVKVVMDIPPALMEIVKEQGNEWGCSQSSATGLLLHVFLKKVDAGQLAIERRLHTTNHPRWSSKLVWPPDGIEALQVG